MSMVDVENEYQRALDHRHCNQPAHNAGSSDPGDGKKEKQRRGIHSFLLLPKGKQRVCPCHPAALPKGKQSLPLPPGCGWLADELRALGKDDEPLRSSSQTAAADPRVRSAGPALAAISPLE